jgi:hypothetical protein
LCPGTISADSTLLFDSSVVVSFTGDLDGGEKRSGQTLSCFLNSGLDFCCGAFCSFESGIDLGGGLACSLESERDFEGIGVDSDDDVPFDFDSGRSGFAGA